ncbi:MAG: Asp-tRNA(Asn)/Glu-tRNA(Gln) amidotransferase subunit GatC [Thermoanaerobaculia bacterium]
MSLSLEEVRRVATLARLRLAPEEESRFAEQLSRVVDYIDQLRNFAGSQAAWRETAGLEAEDIPNHGLPRERFLANAPAHEGPFLVVPRVIGADD